MRGGVRFLKCEIYDSNKYINKNFKIYKNFKNSSNIIFDFQKEFKKNQKKIIKSLDLKMYNSKTFFFINNNLRYLRKCSFSGGKYEKWYHKNGKHEIFPKRNI